MGLSLKACSFVTICDNPPCVNIEHLFLGKCIDNSRDKMRKGRDRKAHGEKNGNAKLTEAQVKEIRASTDRGVDLAARYGVSRDTIYRVRRRIFWC